MPFCPKCCKVRSWEESKRHTYCDECSGRDKFYEVWERCMGEFLPRIAMAALTMNFAEGDGEDGDGSKRREREK